MHNFFYFNMKKTIFLILHSHHELLYKSYWLKSGVKKKKEILWKIVKYNNIYVN